MAEVEDAGGKLGPAFEAESPSPEEVCGSGWGKSFVNVGLSEDGDY